MTFAQTRFASRHFLPETPPQLQGPAQWIVRGANFVVAYGILPEGTTIVRDDVQESICYLPDGGGTFSAGGADVDCGSDASVVIVPPGKSQLTMTRAARVLRVFSTSAQDLAALAVNADVYADGAAEVMPPVPWPAPFTGFALRHYRTSDYRERPMRMFRSANLMINIFDFDGPRDIAALSPHSHPDFEQCSFGMTGQWVHSLRYPWSRNLNDWKEDEHLQIGSPSVLVIPATVIHTSRSTAPGNNQLVDIFCPPRRDFCEMGLVCNADEYPVPPA